jgi:hypothetical protein
MSAAESARVAELEECGVPPGVARKAILRASAVEAAQARAARRGDARALAKCRAAHAQIVAMVFAARVRS